MCCLYCGKEIGAFRLLRDSEFCSVQHRKMYGERLSKSLHDIAAPEPPPAPIAAFRDEMPWQGGNTAPALHLFQRLHLKHVQIPKAWMLTLDLSDPGVAAAEPPPLPGEPASSYPSLVETWMPAPGADPVAAFLKCSASVAPLLAARAPRFATELGTAASIDQARPFPALCRGMQPVPAPEPVAAFVRASSHAIAIESRPAFRCAGNLALAARIDPPAHAPSMAATWEPSPAPEPVTAFVRGSSHTVAIETRPACRFAGSLEIAAQIDPVAHAPSMAATWEPSPAPEPVAAFVQASALTALLPAAHTLQLRHFPAELEPIGELDAVVTPDPCDAWMSSPAAEPVADFVKSSTALAFEAIAFRLPTLSPALHQAPPLSAIAAGMTPLEPITNGSPAIAALTPAFVPGGLQLAALAPAAFPVSRPTTSDTFVARGADSELMSGTPSLAGSLPTAIAAPLLPSPRFTAELEPLPAPDDLLDPPAMCEAFQRALAAEPVFSYLHASVAERIEISRQVTLPAPLDFLAATHVPRVRESQTAPFAEAVMAKVVPVAATAPLVLLRKSAVALPAAPTRATAGPFENPPGVAASARPDVVESLLGAACAIPVSIRRAPRVAALTAPGLFTPAPITADFLPGPEPDPLESPLVAALAVELPMARLRVLPLVLSASLERGIPSFEALQVAPQISQPTPALPRHEAPQPVATLSLTQPGASSAALDSHLPHHDLAPLEFHTARLRGEPVGRPEWIATRVALLPPRFALRAALDKLEEPVAQPKKPVKAPEILNMPAAKRQPTVLMVAGRVAAAFLLASSLWYSVTNYRAPHVNSEDLASSGSAIAHAETSGAPAAAPGGKPAPAAPKGAFALMKQAIADRASLRVAENFKSIDSWEGAGKSRPTGWTRHPDGYMNTGSLALFSPTLKFKDYRMEFFGQIEQKSLGWTVRSKDAQNYHAMKLSVVEAGTRPFVALVQYNVVDGKSGRQTQTPLNIMVHNNRPMQFAIEVKGNHFVTSIDGEEVDSTIDSSLVAGGVGFFSEAGERSRLYWLRVARNDDWLGHVCAMLADTVSTTTGLRTPAGPAGPLPGLPAGEDSMLLGAAWLALPYLRAPRKTQFIKSCRSEPWNS